MNSSVNTTSALSKELSLRAFVLALVLSVVMGAANVYLGLYIGLTVSASIPAAVIGMLILKGLFRDGTILEANQIQTGASAGESLAAGVIFTMPALVLIGVWSTFDYFTTTLVAFTGGLLGILFMIPMRRVFVTSDNPELKFPEGVACAEVLRSGSTQSQGTSGRAVAIGTLVGIVVKVLSSIVIVIKPTLEAATQVAGRIFYFGFDVSPALVAVGFIVRLNIALLMFIGGTIAWLIAMPLFPMDELADPVSGAYELWSGKIRYIGVGAMVVAGVQAIFRVRTGLSEAIYSIRNSAQSSSHEEDEDLPGPLIAVVAALAICCVGGVYYYLTNSFVIAGITTIIMVIMSFFFTAVASYIVGLVGNSNSPVSGMTITAVLFTGGLMLLFGFSGTQGIVATLGVAAVVCCAACTSGDVCNDLKTGQLVGATPWRQQLTQIGGVFVGSLAMAPILQLLHTNIPGGIGGKELAAPQAALFAGLAQGFFSEGHQLPWNMIGIGAGLGFAIMMVDWFLAQRSSGFRLYLMPVAVGMYLPFELEPPLLVGGILAFLMSGKTSEKDLDTRLSRGVLFASGVIAGESLTGVGRAMYRSLNFSEYNLSFSEELSTALTMLTAGIVIYLFYKFTALGVHEFKQTHNDAH